MRKFYEEISRKEIAIVLACTSFFGNRASAMDKSKFKNPQTVGRVNMIVSDNKNLKNKISTPPKDLPKKFYPLWIALSAFGLSAMTILGILCIKKLCSKDSGDQGETPNGTFYYGLGKFDSVEELEKAWGASCGEGQDSRIGKELVKLRTDNKEFSEFLTQDHSKESELANIKGDNMSKEGYHFFSNCAEIRFDDEGNFECYDNKGKKLNLLKWERFFIDYIAKYTKNKLGILPCMVKYDGKQCFYFKFSLDASSEDFKKDLTVNYETHTLLERRFSSHTPIYDKGSADAVLLCELEVWGKKIK